MYLSDGTVTDYRGKTYPRLNVIKISDLYKKLEKTSNYIEATSSSYLNESALMMAMKKNRRARHNAKIFSHYPQLERADREGKTALHYAAENKHRCSLDALKTLLDRGANPTATCEPLPVIYCDCSQAHAAPTHKPSPRRTPLMVAEDQLHYYQSSFCRDAKAAQRIVSFQAKIALLKEAEQKAKLKNAELKAAQEN